MNTKILSLTVPRGLAALPSSVPALFVPDAKAAEHFFSSSTVQYPRQEHALERFCRNGNYQARHSGARLRLLAPAVEYQIRPRPRKEADEL
jgi:hypothetical protein